MSEDDRSYSVMNCFFSPPHGELCASGEGGYVLSCSGTKQVSEQGGVEAVDLGYFHTLNRRFDRVVFGIRCPWTGDAKATTRNVPHIQHAVHVYAKLQHAAIQTGKELVTGADSIGWHVKDSLVRMTYGDEVLDAAEWQVEIVSRPTQRSECVRYEGSRYCRTQEGPGQKARFFRPMFRVEGMVICDETGRVMSLV
jgi:hypothetical protein